MLKLVHKSVYFFFEVLIPLEYKITIYVNVNRVNKKMSYYRERLRGHQYNKKTHKKSQERRISAFSDA